MVSGDFDSLPINIRLKITPSIKLLPTPDQNYTDFEKLLSLLECNYKQVDVYGAGGNEMDHFLGTLSIALKWINKIKISFIDQYSKYKVVENNFKIKNVLNKMVSIMPLSRMSDVYFKGLKYSINGQDLEIGKLVSTRNTAIANEVVINCSKGSFVVFISHENYQ
jgi:thiamine pyrophosphokinase